MSSSSFTDRLLQTESSIQWLGLERLENKHSIFESLDKWLATFWMRFWRGERLCETQFPKGAPPHVRLLGLDEEGRRFVDENFSLAAQQGRGALYHPAKDGLRPGLVNFGWYQKTLPQFVLGAVSEERGTILLDSKGSDAIAIWSIVQEMFTPIAIPFMLRGGEWEEEAALGLWEDWEKFCLVLGLEVAETANPFRPDVSNGRIWASWTMEQQLGARARLWDAMRQSATPEMAPRFRAQLLRTFAVRYVEKTVKGPNTRKKVLNKASERQLSGLFGGDWLRALEYLGETPHPEESIVTALPETRLFVGMEGRIAEVATQTGLPEAEVRLMVEGFWEGTNSSSPIEQRITCLEHYWHEFEALHDQQAPGMTSLWGLIVEYKGLDLPHEIYAPNNDSEQSESQSNDYTQPIPHQPGLYREKLSAALQREVEECWRTTLLPRYPDKLATNLNPHYTLNSAFGVALRFWHGCSLTAWFLCEGPYSRTDLEGMPYYYRKQLDELAKRGAPVDESLFVDLQAAGKKLGPEKPIISREEKFEYGSITISHGSRRDGFELLRDVVALHRKKWAEQYLSTYLKNRWETEVREIGGTYTHQLHASGKAPTAKAFAKTALSVSNHWFGGDLSAFFRTIGEKSPVSPTYAPLMPHDIVAFAIAVRTRLAAHESLRGMRDEPAYYVQLEEVLGRTPDVKEFASGKNDFVTVSLKNDPSLWTAFEAAIHAERVHHR